MPAQPQPDAERAQMGEQAPDNRRTLAHRRPVGGQAAAYSTTLLDPIVQAGAEVIDWLDAMDEPLSAVGRLRRKCS
jgi:hypothetical protein